MANYYSPAISEENFAAWLDGAMSPEQEMMFLDACSQNEDLQELLDANDQIEEDYDNLVENGFVLPYEFESDFEIPQVDVIEDDEDVYDYGQLEPYEQDDSDDDGDITNDAGYDDYADVDNGYLTDHTADDFDLM